MELADQQALLETSEQGAIIQETLFEGPVPTDAEFDAQSRQSTPILPPQMEVGGDNRAVMYHHQQYTPDPFSPERANILEQTTQSIDTSSFSENVQQPLLQERSRNDDDEEMDDPNSVDYHLKPAEVQESEYDRDEGDTRYEGDADEELKEDEENQEDQQEEEYDYTGEDTIPIKVHGGEDEDDGSLPPDGDEEDL